MTNFGTKLKKGDTVRIITGKDAGKEGKILRAIAPVESKRKPRPARVLVEGINIIVKHQKKKPQQNVAASAALQEFGRIEREAPIYASKVQLICPNCGKTTRIALKFAEDGEKFRACKKCDKQLD
jgi:large subunit ribosomal protein L24